MTDLEAMLYRIGREQLANDRKALDGFGCSHEEAALVEQLYLDGWIFMPRREDLLDGPLFYRVALTASGVREWTRLHQIHGRS